MGTVTSCLPQELLDPCPPRSQCLGKFRFPLQALIPSLCGNSETSFSLLGLLSEPQSFPLLAKYRGFYSSSGSMFAGANWRFNEKGNATAGGIIPSCWSQILLIAQRCRTCTFAAGPTTRSGNPKSAFPLDPGPDLKPVAEHTFQTRYKIELFNQLNAI